MHLIKLSVGSETLYDLAEWQRKRLNSELIHITRNMPKRADEVLGGGSLYWVIKGWVCARNRVLELRPLMRDGVPYCGIVYDAELVRVKPRPRRSFQGWRYLTPEDAPADISGGTEDDGLDAMRRELAEMGLL